MFSVFFLVSQEQSSHGTYDLEYKTKMKTILRKRKRELKKEKSTKTANYLELCSTRTMSRQNALMFHFLYFRILLKHNLCIISSSSMALFWRQKHFFNEITNLLKTILKTRSFCREIYPVEEENKRRIHVHERKENQISNEKRRSNLDEKSSDREIKCWLSGH